MRREHLIHSIHAYQSWDGGQNPKFDRVSGQLLDLKNKDDPRYQAACLRFAGEILGYAVTNKLVTDPKNTIGCCVPSSDPQKQSDGLAQVLGQLVSHGLFASAAAGLLLRHTKISKLAYGGDRSISVHRNSICIARRPEIRGKAIFLLDDITTSGNSLLACEAMLLEAGVTVVICMAIGKTAND